MQRISQVTIADANDKAKPILEGLKSAMGKEVQIFGAMANSPALLQGFLNLKKELDGGKIAAKMAEQIASAVAGANKCHYCASAHEFISKSLGVDAGEVSANRAGFSSDPKTQAAITFALLVVEKKGHLSDQELQAARDAGFSDEELTEIIGLVGLNIITNYFNEVFQTEIDFPVIDI